MLGKVQRTNVKAYLNSIASNFLFYFRRKNKSYE